MQGRGTGVGRSSCAGPGTMQQLPLTVTSFLDHAARWHSEQEIVCRTVEGPTVVSTYQDLHTRSQLLAMAMRDLGVR